MEIKFSNIPESISMSKHHFLSSFLLCGLLGITGTIATIPLNLPSAIAQPIPTDENQDAIGDRLYGFWKYIYPENGDIGYILFASDGTLAFVELDEYTQVIQYQIQTNIQPMQLDILYDEGLTLTIFEFTQLGELRVEIENAELNQFRPSEFSMNTLPWEKVPANDPIIPQLQAQIDAKIARKKVEETERFARNELGLMSRAQQAYRLEFPHFADNFDELGVAIPSETQEYRYDIIRQGDRTTSVLMTITPKQRDLRSFASFVYLDDEGRSQVVMCASNMLSSIAPEIIVYPSEPVRCGEGSYALN